MCVFGLKVELYKASTYCRQCLTQKMQSNCNRRGGCIILKISPCHWSAPAVKTALEPTITFWPRRSSGWNVSSFADILHWRRRLWSARHPPLMIRCENCVCSTVCKECQRLSTVTGDKSHYWAQLLHSSSSWSASLTPPVLLVEASKQKMIGQIPDSRNCTKPRHFLLSSQYSFSTFRWKKENDYTFESLLVCEKCAGKGHLNVQLDCISSLLAIFWSDLISWLLGGCSTNNARVWLHLIATDVGLQYMKSPQKSSICQFSQNYFWIYFRIFHYAAISVGGGHKQPTANLPGTSS